MNKFWIVALETFKRNVKSVSFLVMIISPFIMIGFTLLASFVGAKFSETSDIAVISANQELRQNYIKGSTLEVDKKVTTEAEAKKALEAKDIDGYLIISFNEKEETVTGEYTGTTKMGTSDELAMTQNLTATQLDITSKKMALSKEQIAQLNAQAELKSKTVEFKDGKMKEKNANHLAMSMGSIFITLAMYMIILMYAQVTASEVASEKGTRIMEIILSSTSASKHFYGKVMGIFLVILTQVGIYLLAGLGGFMVVKDMPVVKDFLSVMSIKELLLGVFGYNMLYLLLGVIIYTILSALCGSLVSKAEDAGKAVAPVTYLTIFGFMISMMFGMSNPQHILMKVTSYIPFLSSFTMPSRIANGAVSTSEILISLVILAVTTLVLLKFSALMYHSTSLAYGDDGMMKTLKKSFTSMKQERRQRKNR